MYVHMCFMTVICIDVYMHVLLLHSKNDASLQGLSKVIQNLAYSSCIEEVNLSEFGRVRGRYDELSNALARLFQLTVSLKRVSICERTHKFVDRRSICTCMFRVIVYNKSVEEEYFTESYTWHVKCIT